MENLYCHYSSYDPKTPEFVQDSCVVAPWSLPSSSSSSSSHVSTSSCSAFQFCEFPSVSVPFQGFNKEDSKASSSHVSTSSCSAFQFCEFPSVSVPSQGFNKEDSKATAASKSHSQAEKRRRDRINTQLSTLRKLIPKSDKMDKAALLGSVIDHVKDLKRKAIEIGESLVVPTEVDEIIIDSEISDQDLSLITNNLGKNNNNNNNYYYIRASVCCDDRPELFSELIQVLNRLGLTAVRADVVSVGGRIKSVLILSSKDSEHKDQGVCINTLRQSLKLVLSKIASESVVSNCRVRSKRQRFFLPSQCSDHQ